MNVRLSLHLPCDSASVPVARRVLAATLATAGVTEACRADILLALAEACANVVAHARSIDNYEVSVELDDIRCLIEVADASPGFDATALPSEPPLWDESGRGLHIIRAVADQFDVASNDPNGTLLRFAKVLEHIGERSRAE
jgi:serine/threonine-protein kinase RsbW